MKWALVTGASGFIGAAFSAELERRGFRVSRVDIKTGADALDLFHSNVKGFDLVVHAAAHVGGRADIDGKPLYVGATNLELDAALFRWALRTRPGRVVYFSSSAAYPTELQEGRWVQWEHRLSEGDINLHRPMPGDASYGMVKLVGERLAMMAEAEGVRTHVFRPFSGYHGRRQDDTYPFPAFAARARARETPFRVWSDGTQVRDWIHIDDVVGAVMACIDADVPGPVNLCTGRGVSFNDLAGLFTRAAGYNPPIEHVLDAPRGVTHRVGDPSKLLGVYVPKVSVEEGIAEAVRGEGDL